MRTRTKRSYIVTERCVPECSLSRQSIGDDRFRLVHQWLNEGDTQAEVIRKAGLDGFKITTASLQRHCANHTVNGKAEGIPDDSLGELDELSALELAIKQGQKNIPNWKMTPSEWMKAMELKLRLTQGTVFDGMLAAMAAAGADEDDSTDQPENVAEDGERPGAVREQLPE